VLLPGIPNPGERRADQAGNGVVATAETTILTENEQLAGINADYEQRFGFHDAEHYLYKAPEGLSRGDRREDLGVQV
jgi:hypothetical protein